MVFSHTDHLPTKKVAIIGSGIAGLTTAYLLNNYMARSVDGKAFHYQITLFEANDRLGGHTATIDVEENGRTLPIDTGFIVYNDWTYPNFIALMQLLGVANQPTEMSFSVSCRETGLEYGGSTLSSLFAQRRNLVKPAFLQMLAQIVRFNREAVADLQQGRLDPAATLGDYLQQGGYSAVFANYYLVPMCAAIWSASLAEAKKLPLLFFVQFFKNHGLLSINERPQWRVIQGGSRRYIEPLINNFRESIRLGDPVRSVQRQADLVDVRTASGAVDTFDEVVFACHSDQALQLLADPSPAERQVLGHIPYTDNDVVLHRDTRLLPASRRAWSAWNYLLAEGQPDAPVLTYNMNILQSLPTDTTYCVTLNATEAIDPQKIIGRYSYAHPSFSLTSVAAQQQWHRINGNNRTWFCGAYWGNGFHEDGVVSAQRVATGLGVQHQLVPSS